ncbi:MAG: septal ring lytic transglycosylase RlpA family protein, partial [Alphaproteobacteria bacterium]|nr:septal ring lytic transglycosylase RlpA family protein [Alphaproteobacteria bacterium]
MTATSGFGKTPGQRYCFNRTCHRVLTLDETHRRVGTPTTAIASYYRDCKVDRYNPCGLTSSGTVFRPGRADNAASPIYPNGTKLFVWNPATRRAAIVRIDNAGPYKGKRTLDLSVAAAEKLGFRRRGVARLVVQVLSAPTRAEATYRRRRVYAPVRGYLGKFASVQQALATTLPDGATQTQIANVVLPAKNVTAIAQRTVILPGRNLERPVTVANAQSPRIKLPVQYVRAPAPAPVLLPERDRIQLAAVAERFKRQQKLATRRAQRVAALATGKVAGQTAQTKANAETKVAASAASRP